MALGLLWAYFRLPETKRRTFSKIDIFFKNNVKANDLKQTRVDLGVETVRVVETDSAIATRVVAGTDIVQ
jgi:SP family general alpha glucoside:H+ symporter-like MFS transporter